MLYSLFNDTKPVHIVYIIYYFILIKLPRKVNLFVHIQKYIYIFQSLSFIKYLLKLPSCNRYRIVNLFIYCCNAQCMLYVPLVKKKYVQKTITLNKIPQTCQSRYFRNRYCVFQDNCVDIGCLKILINLFVLLIQMFIPIQ